MLRHTFAAHSNAVFFFDLGFAHTTCDVCSGLAFDGRENNVPQTRLYSSLPAAPSAPRAELYSRKVNLSNEIAALGRALNPPPSPLRNLAAGREI